MDKNVKVVVFDWHGVLDRGHFASMFREFWDLSSRNFGGWKRCKMIRLAIKYNRLYKKYNKGFLSPRRFWNEVEEDFGKEVLGLFASIVDTFRPLEKGIDLLENTLSEYRCFLLSDCPVDKKLLIEEKIKEFGWNFEDCFFSCDYGLMKNQKKFFKIFEQETGFKGQEILFWDDNFLNVRKAKMAGWNAKVFKSV